MDCGGSGSRPLLCAAQGQGVPLARQVPERLAASSLGLDQCGHALVHGGARSASRVPGNRRGRELSDELDPGPPPVDALAGDDGRNRDSGLRRSGHASRRLHDGRPAVHGGDRLLVGEHEHPRLGVRVHSHRGVGGPRGRNRGVQVRAGESRGPAHAGPHADGADLRLSDPHPPALRLRSGGRPHRKRDLRLSSDGAQRGAGTAEGAAGHGGIRGNVGGDAAPTAVVGAGPGRSSHHHDRGQSDRDGGAQHGHHRCPHRQLRGYRLGGGEHHAQGRLRSELARRNRGRPDRHDFRPHQPRLHGSTAPSALDRRQLVGAPPYALDRYRFDDRTDSARSLRRPVAGVPRRVVALPLARGGAERGCQQCDQELPRDPGRYQELLPCSSSCCRFGSDSRARCARTSSASRSLRG